MANITETPTWHDAVYELSETDPVLGGPDGVDNLPHKQLAERTRYLRARIDDMTVQASVDVTVGPGGDFVTINAALEELSRAFPTHLAGGLSAYVTLRTGFIMAEQVFVSGVNLGWISIRGEDAMTIIDRAALSREYGGRYPAFAAYSGGWLPVIGQLFEMSSAGTATNRDGVLVSGAGSGVRINNSKGVRRAGGAGLRATSGAVATAPSADFSMAGVDGMVANGGAVIDAAGANVSQAGGRGAWSSAGSTINMGGANASGGTTGGILASLGGRINADTANARMNTTQTETNDIAVATGGAINASGATGGVSQAVNVTTASGIIYR